MGERREQQGAQSTQPTETRPRSSDWDHAPRAAGPTERGRRGAVGRRDKVRPKVPTQKKLEIQKGQEWQETSQQSITWN